jgi:hypothetical protein
MSKITVTVSGPVGAGKTALCNKLEILLKRIGCQVEWVGGEQEKNLVNIEEWSDIPSVPIEIREHVVQTQKVYEIFSELGGWEEVTQEKYDRLKLSYESRIRRIHVAQEFVPELPKEKVQKAPEVDSLLGMRTVFQFAHLSDQTPEGYMMKHKSGQDIGFSWEKNDLKFSEDWDRMGLYTEEQLNEVLVRANEDYNLRAKKWRDSFDAMHRRAMRAEGKLAEGAAVLTHMQESAREQEEVSEQPAYLKLEHVAVAEDGGKLRWMTGRKPRDCELYAVVGDGRAPASLYAAHKPRLTEDQVAAIRFAIMIAKANSPAKKDVEVLEELVKGYPWGKSPE